MKLLLSFVALLAAVQVGSTNTASAARAAKTVESIGYDISYPQCGVRLPNTASFVIIGVNGGTAANTNPCLDTQLTWAKKVVKSNPTAQPDLQLYVNTGNPGEYRKNIATWPTDNFDRNGTPAPNPYGLCQGQNDKACSWQYGWNRAEEVVLDRFKPAAQKANVSTLVSDYTWWLDVETMNTWQYGSAEATERNVAVIEGMAHYYTSPSRGGRIGLYSTAAQWKSITGDTDSEVLRGLPNWRPSGVTLANAKKNCSVAPLTKGGYISMTQYIVKNLDRNHTCI